MTLLTVLRIFLPVALGYYLSYVFRSINAVIAPDLVRDLGVDAGGLGLLTSIYFLSFAAFQLPLGILLDRFGPRRSEGGLLVFAALGAVIFALAEGTNGLVIGRALIGLGVSACLMASFKAFVDWFPKERLPLANGFVLAAGGLGAMSASLPVEWALQFTDWRGVFLALAAATFAVAVVVFLVVPDAPPKDDAAAEGLGRQASGIIEVFTSPVFIRAASLTVASQSAGLSIQGLWSGPWLRDVAGFDRAEIATTLFVMAGTLIAAFLAMGYLSQRLARNGIDGFRFAVGGMALFAIAQAVVISGWTGAVLPLWIGFSIFATSGVITYAALSQAFPPNMAGRVNTALNLLVFLGAFAAQWGIGAMIDLWPQTAEGGFPVAGYQAAFAAILAVQLMAFLWYVAAGFMWSRRRGP